MPFRVLRPDPDTDFLAFSLPDAITGSLSGLDSLVVRSSLLASRFAGDAPDLARIATEADADVALTGTILRAGDELRVSSQLVEVPGGAVLWSHAYQMQLRDVFQIQDEIVHRIVESLSLPLTAREHRRLSSDVPASSTAYEFYLRANQLSRSSDDWTLARDLYLRSIEEDPRYAPAWARLARCHRLIGKYAQAGASDLTAAEAAFRRALELNPDLPIAHNQYAHLEADTGNAGQAMVRLVARAHASRSDPELFAGLVHVCRYCGLLEASAAADERARRLDPHVRTSVTHTFFMMRDYQRTVDTSAGDIGYVDALALVSMDRGDEARRLLRERIESPHPMIQAFRASLLALAEGRRADSIELTRRAIGLEFRDPEARYYLARQLAHLGEHEAAVAELTRVVEEGFCCFPAFARDPWLGPLAGRAGFVAALRQAETRHQEAVEAFLEVGGGRLLGVPGRTEPPPAAR
jgi:TolB-like protein